MTPHTTPTAGGRAAWRSSPESASNTVKTRTFGDGGGRPPFSGVAGPERMHDRIAVRAEGIAEQLRCRPGARLRIDDGYRTWPSRRN